MKRGVYEMNYDGPSFYKRKEANRQENKATETPLNHLKKKGNRSEPVSRKIDDKQESSRNQVGSHYFRSTQIPKSLQNRVDWKEETWNQELLLELQKRLKKDSEDFLLFADDSVEKVEVETKESNKKTLDDTSAEALRIKKMVEKIESTLDTAALAQKEIKPDYKKTNTALHRTLSNIMAKEKKELKND